jgi:hypothetical protein
MRELGIEVPDQGSVRLSPWLRLQARLAPIDRLLAAREAAEMDEVDDRYRTPTGDAGTDALLRDIRKDERPHSLAVNEMRAPNAPARGHIRNRQRRLGRDRRLALRARRGGLGRSRLGAVDGHRRLPLPNAPSRKSPPPASTGNGRRSPSTRRRSKRSSRSSTS